MAGNTILGTFLRNGLIKAAGLWSLNQSPEPKAAASWWKRCEEMFGLWFPSTAPVDKDECELPGASYVTGVLL